MQPIGSTFGPVVLTARAPAKLSINAPVTAGTFVELNSDTTHVAAPVTGGTVTIAPVTVGRATSLGVETEGALSLTQTELALISASDLTIGGSTVFSPISGPVTIAAPLDLNVGSLNLTSTGAITQDIGAPIRLTRPGPSGQRIGDLDVRSTGAGDGNASIYMPAPNEVPGVLRFATGGANNDFDFAYALPVKPQFIVNDGVSGKVRIAPFGSPPVVGVPLAAPEEQALSVLRAQIVSAMDRLSDINDAFATTGEEDRKKAADDEKNAQEEQ
jgi:hypothetical protein